MDGVLLPLSSASCKAAAPAPGARWRNSTAKCALRIYVGASDVQKLIVARQAVSDHAAREREGAP